MYDYNFYGDQSSPSTIINNCAPANAYYEFSTSSESFSFYSSKPSNYESQSKERRDVMVGNLSFFCEEQHLFDLFNGYAEVAHTRIMRSDKNSEKINRSLLYGFVTFATPHEAKEMATLMDGTVFMGRKIKVKVCRDNEQFYFPQEQGIQLHINFSSKFYVQGPQSHIVCPTEQLLRKVFVKYGTVLDVSVKSYVVHEMVQQGYGFVTFSTASAAKTVPPHIAYKGIHFQCSLTHKHSGKAHSGTTRRSKDVSVPQGSLGLPASLSPSTPLYVAQAWLGSSALQCVPSSTAFAPNDYDSEISGSASSSRPLSLSLSLGESSARGVSLPLDQCFDHVLDLVSGDD